MLEILLFFKLVMFFLNLGKASFNKEESPLNLRLMWLSVVLLIFTVCLTSISSITPISFFIPQKNADFFMLWCLADFFMLLSFVFSQEFSPKEVALSSLTPCLIIILDSHLSIPIIFVIVLLYGVGPKSISLKQVGVLCFLVLSLFYFSSFERQELSIFTFSAILLLGYALARRNLFPQILKSSIAYLPLLLPSFEFAQFIPSLMVAEVLVFIIFYDTIRLFFSNSSFELKHYLTLLSLGWTVALSFLGYSPILFFSILSSFSILLVVNLVMIRVHNSEEDSLKEIFSKDQSLWFFIGLSLLGLIGFPPSSSFAIILSMGSLPLLFQVLIALLFLSPCFFFLLSLEKSKYYIPQKLHSFYESKTNVAGILILFFFISICIYSYLFYIAPILNNKPYNFSMSLIWFLYLILSSGIIFFSLTSSSTNASKLKKYLPVILDRDFTAKRATEQRVAAGNIDFTLFLPRIPTQWAFLSWGLTLALCFGLLYMVKNGS